MVLIAGHTWSATDGSPWDPAKWTMTVLAGASATIQGGRGVMTTVATAYGAGVRAQYIEAPAVVDGEATIDVIMGPSKAEQYLVVGLRDNGGNGPGSFPARGYFAEVSWMTNAIQLRKTHDGNTFTLLGSAAVVAGGIGTSTTYTLRFRLEGGRVRVKMWPASSTEPIEWTYDYTDPAPYLTAGRPILTVQNGNAAVARTWVVDNLNVDDLALIASRAATTSGSGQLAAEQAPRLIRSAALASNGELTATAGVAMNAALTGSGSLTAEATQTRENPIAFWDGAAWREVVPRRWNGSAWVATEALIWNGRTFGQPREMPVRVVVAGAAIGSGQLAATSARRMRTSVTLTANGILSATSGPPAGFGGTPLGTGRFGQ